MNFPTNLEKEERGGADGCGEGVAGLQEDVGRAEENEKIETGTDQCFGSGKKYYGSGSYLKIISRIRIRFRIRILLEIILYCFTEGYF